MPITRFAGALALSLLALNAPAAIDFPPAASERILPPVAPWNGKSRELIAPKNDPWITPAEKSDFRLSPSYDETVAWLRKLVAAAPQQLKMISLGKSPENRDLWMIIASRDGAGTPDALRKNGKPTVLAQAGIHAGEIDGKDAGLMLLRDMTVRGKKSDLLDEANFLCVPIFNVDGHERATKYGRVNQRGPEITGWRTNAKNLNLNRDYAKVDTLEMAAMIGALNAWRPDLYLDLHVSDGADYQYDTTFGFNGSGGHSPAIADWLEKTFAPALTKDLTAMGHVPGPTDVANWVDPLDLSKGIRSWMADARFSNGYGDARHLPAVLVENHSLKPYERRVLGTYVLLESTLRTVAKNVAALRQAIASDCAADAPAIPFAWDANPKATSETIDFKAIESRPVLSAISGSVYLRFTGKPITERIPYLRTNHPSVTVKRPKAYWIPPAWNDIVQKLELHGIQVERIAEPREVEVTSYRLEDVAFQGGKAQDVYESQPFEGHVQLTAKPVATKRTERFPAGSVRVRTDQPLGDLAAVLLEPASPDSFFQWGFFNEILQPTEYIESYVMEPMAEKMLASDPKLAAEFREKVANDEAFRASAKNRLRWFYERTPFSDERWKMYPVAREE